MKGPFIAGSDSRADNWAVDTPPASTCDRIAAPGPQPGLRAWCCRLALLLVTAWAPPQAGASERQDHERARAAVQAGEVLPLPTLLERVQRSHPGQVLELELEREDGRWVYEIRLLQAGGQLLKLHVDAATGQVLKAGRKDLPAEDRPAPPAKAPPR